MPAYSLGNFTFIYANVEGVRGGMPPLPTEKVSVFNTAGIDGASVRNEGRWGEPFRYRTCAQSDTPVTLKTTYEQAPGQVPQNLIWEGNDFDDAEVRFTIQSVGEFEINRMSRVIVDGSLWNSGAATYFLHATWILVPVDMS